LDRKVYYKNYSSSREEIDYMLQERQVVSTVGNQIDKGPVGTEYAITRIHPIDWMLISIIVTIKRTIALSESYENSHYIMTTTKLRSCS